jgi:hypothetical protein
MNKAPRRTTPDYDTPVTATEPFVDAPECNSSAH